MILSFSGIDGAGKSTQISELDSWLTESGLRTAIVTFWDDVAVMSGYREFMSRVVFRRDQGVGSPQKPLCRRDKNVSSGPLTLIRLFLYFVDAVNLWLKVRGLRERADVVIFDRYIYDELANLPLDRRMVRTFAWVVLKMMPKPDVSYVIDADPVAAHLRKPEYPLNFVYRNHAAYFKLARLAGDMIVVEPGPVPKMQKRIRQEMLRELWTGTSIFAVGHSSVPRQRATAGPDPSFYVD